MAVDRFRVIIFFLVHILSYFSSNIEYAHIRGFCGELSYSWIPRIQNSVGEPSSWGEVLRCECKVGNSHDTYAVAIKKLVNGNYVVVGHVPRKISSICSIFIRRGGTIHGTINGN